MMKKFLQIMGLMLLGALLTLLGLYGWLQWRIHLATSQLADTTMVTGSDTSTAATTDTAQGSDGTLSDQAEVIPLRDLPLTDAQADMLLKFGIDRETFVITPEMSACAEKRLGATRFAEIVGGAAPSTLEAAELLTCL